nr:MAG TPA: hypothetical protein [Crassvirales sp.]
MVYILIVLFLQTVVEVLNHKSILFHIIKQ